jgi:undecaprenyl-diphosphatase
MPTLTYPEMIVVGLLQGVTELFPISSLGHSVLVPALVGGSWATDLDMSAPGSPYLNTLVAMHVATAAALVIFFWRDWVRLIRALLGSIRDRQIASIDQRLAWLLVVGTIPVGLAGLALDKLMREYLGKPVPAAVFLTVNGLVLIVVERRQRRSRAARPASATEANIKGHPTAADPFADTIKLPAVTDSARREPRRPARGDQSHNPSGDESNDESNDVELARLGWGEAITIGACQALALLPGISRSGATIAGGLLRGLSHQDAARFAFLLATPVIAAAGLLKLPELARPEMHSAIGPTLVGSLVAGIGAYLSVRFLTRYFHTHNLNPFAIYCIVGGLGSLGYLTLA